MKKDSDIIIFPQLEDLKNAVKKLRAEIPRLLQERDELLHVVCKNLEMQYMLKVGALECQAFKEECDYLRLKRKAELIQAHINRREDPDMRQIDRMLERELEDYHKKLNAQYEALEKMIEYSKGKVLGEKEQKELKETYYRIVKILHPDLNPNISEREKALFLQAVQAYQDGDLARIKIINEAIADSKEILETNSSSQLNKEIDRLGDVLAAIHADIAAIKGRFPYNKKADILNDEWIKQRREELQGAIDGYKAAAEKYVNRIRELIGDQ